jgi:hypothetical protein
VASHVATVPVARDKPALTPHTIQDFTTGAIDMFPASKNADKQAFNVKGPWSAIGFAGATGETLTTGQINNDVFKSCDTQKDRQTNKTVSFSSVYKDFVQDVSSFFIRVVSPNFLFFLCSWRKRFRRSHLASR